VAAEYVGVLLIMGLHQETRAREETERWLRHYPHYPALLLCLAEVAKKNASLVPDGLRALEHALSVVATVERRLPQKKAGKKQPREEPSPPKLVAALPSHGSNQNNNQTPSRENRPAVIAPASGGGSAKKKFKLSRKRVEKEETNTPLKAVGPSLVIDSEPKQPPRAMLWVAGEEWWDIVEKRGWVTFLAEDFEARTQLKVRCLVSRAALLRAPGSVVDPSSSKLVIECLEHALRLDPGCAVAALNMTIELWKEGRKTLACECWLGFLEVLLDRDPAHYTALSAAPPALTNPSAPSAPPPAVVSAVSGEVLRYVSNY
jgi:hypothetical protein